jgi:hypothetical protein
MTGPDCDFSEEYFTSVLGPEVVADIRRSVDEAPDPSPELIERLRQIFAPAARRLLAEQCNPLAEAQKPPPPGVAA